MTVSVVGLAPVSPGAEDGVVTSYTQHVFVSPCLMRCVLFSSRSLPMQMLTSTAKVKAAWTPAGTWYKKATAGDRGVNHT